MFSISFGLDFVKDWILFHRQILLPDAASSLPRVKSKAPALQIKME
jgi:hypothetical protein